MVETRWAQGEWASERLGMLGRWLSGGTPSMANSEYWGGDIPWVSPKDMKRSRLWDAIDHVTEKALGNGTRLAPAHALLLVVRGMILAHTFPVARAELPLAFNQDIKALVPRDDVDSNYLLWWLTAHEALILGITTESTHGTKRVPTDGLHGVEINLPPFAEQCAIATALSDVDALLDGLDRVIAKKRDLKQAAMQQLLTGQTRLPGFRGEWKVERLGELAEMGSGGTPLSSVAAYYDGDIPWVAISDMTRGSKFIQSTERNLTALGLGNSAAQIFPAGTVLYAMYASLGECSIAGVSLCTSQAILGIRPNNNLDADFLYYYLTSLKPIVKSLGQQGTQSNLNKGIVQDFRVRLPSVSEQSAIAAVLSDMDAELGALEARRDKTRAIKQGMMQELLSGGIRLVPGKGADA